MTQDVSVNQAAIPQTDHSLKTGDADHKQPAMTEGGIDNYTDGYAYEVPRPFLTLKQAAALLGKSLRSIERSLLGRWGNKLPEGWLARKIRTDEGEEWRILPPPGFRVRQMLFGTEGDTTNGKDNGGPPEAKPAAEARPVAPTQAMHAPPDVGEAGPFTFEAVYRTPHKPKWRPDRHSLDQPTIVIDRTEEVEHLLRELVIVQKALAEERRLHLEDLRVITQLQSSMRLLEANHTEHQRAKSELETTKQELALLKMQYNQLVSMSFWQRLFFKA